MDPEIIAFIDGVDHVAQYTDYFIFACLLLAELFVFVKLGFKIDKSGILTLVVHLIVSIIRIIRSSLDDDLV